MELNTTLTIPDSANQLMVEYMINSDTYMYNFIPIIKDGQFGMAYYGITNANYGTVVISGNNIKLNGTRSISNVKLYYV